MKKRVSVILAMVMCFALTIPAFAVAPESETSRWTFDSEGTRVYIVGDDVDTSPHVISSQKNSTRGRSLLFTMNLSAMYTDLHTTGSKSFTKASLSNSYVRASGKIDSTHDYVTVGLCEYDDGFFAPQWTLQDVDCGEYFAVSWKKADLSSYLCYYGYAQSPYGTTTYPYSGYIDYYDSSVN